MSSALLASRFSLTRVTYTGGMGQVFAGTDLQSGQPVAVKLALPLPGAAEALAREARALALVDHPAIVRYVAHGQTPDRQPYLVMEWIDGERLSDRLRHGRLDATDAIDVAVRALSALGHLHKRGFVHRDVTPANLLLVDGDPAQAMLVDFGGVHGVRASGSFAFQGSVAYSAPECFRAEPSFTPSADLFSLGAVLFECLSGTRAFAGDDALAVMSKVALSEPDFASLPTNLPSAVVSVLRRLLSKLPERRPADAAAAIEALQRSGQGHPSLSASRVDLSAVSMAERRLISIVASRRVGSRQPVLLAELSTNEALVGHLEGEAVVIAYLGRDSASAQVRQALQRARELSAAGPVAIVSGWAEGVEEAVPSEWIDRCVQLLGSIAGEVRLDELTAGLAPAEADVTAQGESFRLRGASSARPPRRVSLVGRRRELRTLRAAVEDAFQTPRAVILAVTGAPGIGKSKLVEESIREVVREGGPRVLRLTADALRARSPLALAAQLAAEALGLQGAKAPQGEALLGAVVALGCPEPQQMAGFLGALVGTREHSAVVPEVLAAREDPVLMREQLRLAMTQLVHALARSQPLLIAIEDLQWADAATLELFDSVFDATRDLPLVVLVTARPRLFEEQPDLWHRHDLQELRVIELTRRASHELVEQLPHGELSAEDLQWVVETAAGNPLYLQELLRARRSGQGPEVPTSVVAMVKTRIESLDPEARRVLRAASVFGARFAVSGVSELVGGSDVERSVQEWLATLEEREFVDRVVGTSDEGAEFRFRHALVGEAAYAMLASDDRRAAHFSAAQWLEAMGEPDAAVLGRHYELGGAPELAAPYFHRAAALALERGDFVAARLHVARGLDSARDPDLAAALTRAAAEAERLAGDLPLAARLSAQALEQLTVGSSRWFGCVAERALVLQRLGESQPLASLAEALLAAQVDRGADEARIAAALRVALSCSRLGMLDLARECRALAVARGELLGPVTLAWTYAVDAIFARDRGDHAEYLEQALACQKQYDRLGDIRSALEQRINIGSTYMELGLLDDARSMLEAALEDAARLNLLHLAAGARHNLGLCLGRLGRYDEAIALEREAIETFRHHDKRLEGGARVAIGLIALWSGRLELGLEEIRLALGELASAAPPLVPVAQTVMAALALADGRIDDALAQCALADAGVAAAGAAELAEPLLTLTKARALLASGDSASALEVARGGWTQLQEQAGRLSSERLRHGVLHGLPEARSLRTLLDGLERK
ncbi:MAG: protein kinase [Polyangiaceae bacterium]